MHTRRMVWSTAAAMALAATVAAVPAQAAGNGATTDGGTLVQLNSSGVWGQVTLVARDGQVRVNLNAHGLEAGRFHMEHLHGFGNGKQATCPDMSLAGSDGVISFAEGLPAYGPPLITLDAGVLAGSTRAYSKTFTATNIGAPMPVSSLGALDQYVVVVHGMTLPDGSYDMTTPVACAVISMRG